MNRKLYSAIILVALLIGVLVLGVKSRTGSSTEVLRVAFPYAKPSSAYEPARIHLAPEYIFLENIYSPLVEISPRKGEIDPGVAESYYWKGTELHLKIRENLRTISGELITARDAEFSLKRLLSLPGNTHGDFRELICGSKEFHSVDDDCEGIRVEGSELVLKTTKAGTTFLLPMLAAIDFAIIPKSSVNLETLAIKDFKNTTGPYYVSRDSDDGRIEFRANPNHYHYSAKMPQVVELVPSDLKNPHSSFDDFKSNRVDFITTVDMARADDLIAFSRTQSDATLFTTMNIRSFVLSFSDRGLRELTSKERFAIGKKVREIYWRTFAGKNGYEISNQFFPSVGDGALDEETIRSIDRNFEAANEIPTRKLRIAFVRIGDTTGFMGAMREALPQADMVEQEKNTDFMKFSSTEEIPHITICGPDTGFLEDIGLISYTLNAGYFGMEKENRQKWLRAYMDVSEKSKRLDLLREAHEKALRAPVIVPLLVAPYAALARKPWKPELSQFIANNQLWLVRHD